MPPEHRYYVLLQPTGVAIPDALELRFVDVRCAAPSVNHVTDDIDTVLREESGIDAYALHHHWEVAGVFADLGVPAEPLKRGLDTLTTGRANRLRNHASTRGIDLSTADVSFRRVLNVSRYDHAHLPVDDQTAEAFTQLVETYCPDPTDPSINIIHEAIVRVVSDRQPDLWRTFASDPLHASETFVATAQTHADSIEDHLLVVR
jgi:hypothetical protein